MAITLWPVAAARSSALAKDAVLIQDDAMKRALAVAVLVVLCIVGLFQYRAMRELKAAGARLRAQLDDARALMDAHQARVAEQPRDAELERAEQAELNRLRGQVAELRREIKAAQASAKAQSTAASASTNQPASELVHRFAANIEMTVPPEQTLVTGGWKLPSGKHGLFFIEPVAVDAVGNRVGDASSANQVVVQARIVELPEETLARYGLTALKNDAVETGGKMLLGQPELKELFSALEQEPEVSVVAAPRVITLSGRQAQIKIADAHTTHTGEFYETGPVLDIVPSIAADGRSIDLRLSAEMRLKK
jgi:hypothetical protein